MAPPRGSFNSYVDIATLLADNLHRQQYCTFLNLRVTRDYEQLGEKRGFKAKVMSDSPLVCLKIDQLHLNIGYT